MSERDDGHMRDSEIALMDAIKTLLEIMLMRGTVNADGLSKIFAFQRDGYLAKRMPTAAAVMEMLRAYVADQARATQREEIRRFLEEPPQGRA